MMYYKWIRVDYTETPPAIECTKDYIPEGNEYINEANGWRRTNDSIEFELKEEEDERETH